MTDLWRYQTEKPEKYAGKKILIASFDEDEVRIKFEDSVTIKIWDNGQSCCETRYLRTDDDFADLEGKTLHSIEVKDGGERYERYGVHEVAFLEIKTTDGGTVTFSSHNEHNGYYGGFGLSIDEV